MVEKDRPDKYLNVDDFDDAITAFFLEMGITHFVYAARHPDSDMTVTGNSGDPLWCTGIMRVMEKDLYMSMKEDQEDFD